VWYKKCGIEDVPWLMEFAKRHYGDLLKNYQETGVWLAHRVMQEDVLILRTERAALVTTEMVRVFDGRLLHCAYLYAGNIWELLTLFRAALAWARTRGGKALEFGCDTGYDMAPLAKRLGARLKTDDIYYSMES